MLIFYCDILRKRLRLNMFGGNHKQIEASQRKHHPFLR